MKTSMSLIVKLVAHAAFVRRTMRGQAQTPTV